MLGYNLQKELVSNIQPLDVFQNNLKIAMTSLCHQQVWL